MSALSDLNKETWVAGLIKCSRKQSRESLQLGKLLYLDCVHNVTHPYKHAHMRGVYMDIYKAVKRSVIEFLETPE
jgi:hypothetical protein